jgi:hypothetical protein
MRNDPPDHDGVLSAPVADWISRDPKRGPGARLKAAGGIPTRSHRPTEYASGGPSQAAATAAARAAVKARVGGSKDPPYVGCETGCSSKPPPGGGGQPNCHAGGGRHPVGQTSRLSWTPACAGVTRNAREVLTPARVPLSTRTQEACKSSHRVGPSHRWPFWLGRRVKTAITTPGRPRANYVPRTACARADGLRRSLRAPRRTDAGVP